jgi:hypothetical protein
MTTFTLQNDNLVLEFNHANGALVGLRAILTDWKIINRPSLGLLMIGETPVTEQFTMDTGADIYAPDAASAAQCAKQFMQG